MLRIRFHQPATIHPPIASAMEDHPTTGKSCRILLSGKMLDSYLRSAQIQPCPAHYLWGWPS